MYIKVIKLNCLKKVIQLKIAFIASVCFPLYNLDCIFIRKLSLSLTPSKRTILSQVEVKNQAPANIKNSQNMFGHRG